MSSNDILQSSISKKFHPSTNRKKVARMELDPIWIRTWLAPCCRTVIKFPSCEFAIRISLFILVGFSPLLLYMYNAIHESWQWFTVIKNKCIDVNRRHWYIQDIKETKRYGRSHEKKNLVDIFYVRKCSRQSKMYRVHKYCSNLRNKP